MMIDIPDGSIRIQDLPAPPDGMEIVNVDVVVRLRRRPS